MKIAILVPSRNRPKEFYRLVDSLNKTISGKNNIELVVSIDTDDPSKEDYGDIFNKIKLLTSGSKLHVQCKFDYDKSVARLWNDMANSITADYYMLANDDLIFLTKNWDLYLGDKIHFSFHPYNLYWFDDGINQERNCCFPIVSREWIQTLGYFISERFHYFYCETYIWDIAKQAGVAVYIPQVKLQHLHFSVNKDVPFDSTYARNRKNNTSKFDESIFEMTRSIRHKEAQVIKNKIYEHINPKTN